jgi:hypothetical protein
MQQLKFEFTPGPWASPFQCPCGYESCGYYSVGPGHFTLGTGFDLPDARLVQHAPELAHLAATVAAFEAGMQINEVWKARDEARELVEKIRGVA